MMAYGCLKTDATGLARPHMGYCDAGAAEYIYVSPLGNTMGSTTGTYSLSR